MLTQTEPTNKRRDVYNSIKQAKGKAFTISEEQFNKRLDTEPDYANGIWETMRGLYGEDFAIEQDKFTDELKKKVSGDPSTASSAGTSTAAPSTSEVAKLPELGIAGALPVADTEEKPKSLQDIINANKKLANTPMYSEALFNKEKEEKVKRVAEEKKDIVDFGDQYGEYLFTPPQVANDESLKKSNTIALYKTYLAEKNPQKLSAFESKKKYLQEGGASQSLPMPFTDFAPEVKDLETLEANFYAEAINFKQATLNLQMERLNAQIKSFEDAVASGKLNPEMQQRGAENLQRQVQLLSAENANNEQQAKNYASSFPMEAKRLLQKKVRQQTADAAYDRGVGDMHMAVASQVGRSITSLAKNLLSLPKVVAGNNEYGWTDRLSDVSTAVTESVDDAIFPEPTKFKKGLIENAKGIDGKELTDADGKKVKEYNWDLLLPKSVRMLSDMGLQVGLATATGGAMGGSTTALAAGTVASGFAMTANDYYEEAIQQGLTPKEASIFSTRLALQQGMLELINPEAIVFRKAVTGSAVRNFAENLAKGVGYMDAVKEAGKVMLKNVVGENVQEFAQAADERVSKLVANQVMGKEAFETNDFYNESLETVILTTIASGLFGAAAGGLKEGKSELMKKSLWTAAQQPQQMQARLQQMVATGTMDEAKAQRLGEVVNQLAFNLNAVPGKANRVKQEKLTELIFDKMQLNETAAAPGLDENIKGVYDQRIADIDAEIATIVGGDKKDSQNKSQNEKTAQETSMPPVEEDTGDGNAPRVERTNGEPETTVASDPATIEKIVGKIKGGEELTTREVELAEANEGEIKSALIREEEPETDFLQIIDTGNDDGTVPEDRFVLGDADNVERVDEKTSSQEKAGLDELGVLGVKVPTVAEIFAKPNAHMSDMLDATLGAYAPAWDKIEEIDKQIKQLPKGNKAKHSELKMERDTLELRVQQRQIEWGEELAKKLKSRAKELGYSGEISDEGITEMTPYFTDGRVMESYYNDTTVQQLADDLIKEYYEAEGQSNTEVQGDRGAQSETDGKRLTDFGLGDVVYRNYNGRYEEYKIIKNNTDLWKLEKTDSGAVTQWNAANNGGFILKQKNENKGKAKASENGATGGVRQAQTEANRQGTGAPEASADAGNAGGKGKERSGSAKEEATITYSKLKDGRKSIERVDRRIGILDNGNAFIYDDANLTEKEVEELKNAGIKNIEYEQNEKEQRDSETLLDEGEAVIAEAEVADTREKRQSALQKIEDAINAIDSKIGKLTESYSTEDIAHELPNKEIGKKAKAEINKYAKEIIRLTGWAFPVDKKGKPKLPYDNIAPAGGDVTFRLAIPNTTLEMYVAVKYDPEYSTYYDDYKFTDFFYRVEDTAKSGYNQYVGANRDLNKNVTAKEFAIVLAKEAQPYLERYKKTEQPFFKEVDLLKGDLPDKKQLEKDRRVAMMQMEATAKMASAMAAPEINKAKRKIRDEKLDKELDGLWDDFRKDNKATSGPDPERLAKAVKIITKYTEAGIYKLSDIAEDVYARIGDAVIELVDEIKDAYLSYWQRADERIAEQMDEPRDVKKFDFNQFIINFTDDEPGTQQLEGNAESDAEGAEARSVPANATGKQTGSVPAEASRMDGSRNAKSNAGGKSKRRPGKRVAVDPVYGDAPVNYSGDGKADPTTFNVGKKYQDNIDALRLLGELLAQKRQATAEEQAILAKYVGYGGLKEILFEKPGQWSASNLKYKPLVETTRELVALLDPDGKKKLWNGIRDSTLNAHYTPAAVIKGIYHALERLGFKGGAVLEPSAGIGNFFANMPSDMQKNSQLHGIELDYITGNILKQLYPQAKIQVQGYEKAKVPSGYYDAVISNVPFGDYSVYDPELFKKDKRYEKISKHIHSYFFIKALDSVRPGGLVVFVTSKGVMDSPGNETLRKVIAEKADFLGSVRLGNTAFKGNANTEVVTDIIFLRKTDKPTSSESFVDLAPIEVTDGDKKQTVKVNKYYVDYPQRVIGEYGFGGNYHGDVLNVKSPKETDFEQVIKDFADEAFASSVYEGTKRSEAVNAETEKAISYDEHLQTGNLVMDKGEVKRVGEITVGDDGKKSFEMLPVKISKANEPKVPLLIKLRETLYELMFKELHDYPAKEQDRLRKKLNIYYDEFYDKYGRLADKDNKSLLGYEQGSSYVLQALEVGEKGKVQKSDIFKKATIKPIKKLGQADNVTDALLASLAEYNEINPERISELLKRDWEDIMEEAKGIIFKVPGGGYEYKDSYLSGNVKNKLEQAKEAVETDDAYQVNVRELEKVQPEDIPATEIYAPLGARWIPSKYFAQFISELLGAPASVSFRQSKDKYGVGLSGFTPEQKKYSTARRGADWVFEHALNNLDPKVTYVSDEKTYVDEKDTQLARQIYKDVRDKFMNDWLWKDDERRKELGRIYNDRYNNVVLRKYDGSHLMFAGLAGYNLDQHQKDAAWMLLQNKGGVIDHIVGAGKTLVMASSVMEMKRLGIAKKPMVIGLKAQVPQMVKEFQHAYPNAKILAPIEKDFTKDNRKKLMAKIATNDWDAIIITHENFARIEQSAETQMELMQEQLDLLEKEKRDSIGDQGSKRQEQGLQKAILNYKNKMEKLRNTVRDTELRNFEELGIDMLFVDESQQFKNLEFFTKKKDIRGLGNTTGSKRAFNMLIAARTIQRLRKNDEGIVFASGTPISNSMSEMYLLLKYLRPTLLHSSGIKTFDAWADLFADSFSDYEYYMGKFKEVTRFRKFVNLPELAKMYREIADVRNELNLKLPRPKANHSLAKILPTEGQLRFINDLQEFVASKGDNEAGEKIGVHLTEEQKGAYSLIAVNLAKKLSMDMRLIYPDAGEQPGGKIDQATDKIADIYKESGSYKGTQLVFSDIGTPKTKNTVENLFNYLEEMGTNEVELEEVFGENFFDKAANQRPALKVVKERLAEVMGMSNEAIEGLITEANTADRFNVYDEIKRQLVAKGVPAAEIAYIHDYNGSVKRAELYHKVREGEIRVLIGSTVKMGVGVNVQKKAIAAHHLDIPWKPSDLEQRNGRVERRGNEAAEKYKNNEVDIHYYATERTLDAYMYEIVNTKSKFIKQVRLGDTGIREIDEIDDNVGIGTMAAELSGNPLFKEKMKLEKWVSELSNLRKRFEQAKIDAKDAITKREGWKTESMARAERMEAAQRTLDKNSVKNDKGAIEYKAIINGKQVESAKEAGEELIKFANGLKGNVHVKAGSIYGFDIYIHNVVSSLGQLTRYVEIHDGGLKPLFSGTMSADPVALGTGLRRNLFNLQEIIDSARGDVERYEREITKFGEQTEGSFGDEQEYQEKRIRLDVVKKEIEKETNAAKEKPQEPEPGEDALNEEHIDISYGNKEEFEKSLDKTALEIRGEKTVAFLRSEAREANAGWAEHATAALSETGSLLERFEERTLGSDVKGTQITSAQDVADLSLILRSPNIEKTTYIYSKGGRVVGSRTATYRVNYMSPTLDILSVKDDMKALDADAFWLVHNHPSGNHEPSIEDGLVTENIINDAIRYGITFKGHVIINSEKFSFISDVGKATVLDYLRKPAALFTNRIAIGSSTDAAYLAQALLKQDGFNAHLIHLNGNMQVAKVEPLPTGMSDQELYDKAISVSPFYVIVHNGRFKLPARMPYGLKDVINMGGQPLSESFVTEDKNVTNAAREKKVRINFEVREGGDSFFSPVTPYNRNGNVVSASQMDLSWKKMEYALAPPEDMKKPRWQRLKEWWQNLSKSLDNPNRALTKIEEDVRREYGLAKKTPVPLGRVFEQNYVGKALQNTDNYINAVTKGLNPEGVEALTQYLFNKRVIDRYDAMAEEIAKGNFDVNRSTGNITREDAEHNLHQLKERMGTEKFADIKKRGQLHLDMMDAALQNLLDAGMLSAEQYDDIKRLNKFYAPFAVMQKVFVQDFGDQLATMSNPVKRIGGISFKSQDFTMKGLKKLQSDFEGGMMGPQEYFADALKMLDGALTAGNISKPEYDKELTLLSSPGFNINDILSESAKFIYKSTLSAEKNRFMQRINELRQEDTEELFFKDVKGFKPQVMKDGSYAMMPKDVNEIKTEEGFLPVKYFVDGKPKFFAVDKDVAELVNGMTSKEELTGLQAAMRTTTRIINGTARHFLLTMNPVWRAKNFVIDAARQASLSKYGLFAGNDVSEQAANALILIPQYIEAYMHTLAANVLGVKSKMYKDFVDSGAFSEGRYADLFDSNKNQLKESVLPSNSNKVLEATKAFLYKLPKYIVYDLATNTAKAEEQAHKLVGFNRGKSAEGLEVEGLTKWVNKVINKMPSTVTSAADLRNKMDAIIYETQNEAGSPNFSAIAPVIKYLNSFLYFFGANLKGGMSDWRRVLKADGTLTKKEYAKVQLQFMVTVVLPAVLLAMRNIADDDDEEQFDTLSTYDRNNNLNVPTGGTFEHEGKTYSDYLKIPQRGLPAIVNTIANESMKMYKHEDPGAWDEIAGAAIGQTTPVKIMGDTPKKWLNSFASSTTPVFKFGIEYGSNTNTFRTAQAESDKPVRYVSDKLLDAYGSGNLNVYDVKTAYTKPYYVELSKMLKEKINLEVTPITLQLMHRNLLGGAFRNWNSQGLEGGFIRSGSEYPVKQE